MRTPRSPPGQDCTRRLISFQGLHTASPRSGLDYQRSVEPPRCPGSMGSGKHLPSNELIEILVHRSRCHSLEPMASAGISVPPFKLMGGNAWLRRYHTDKHLLVHIESTELFPRGWTAGPRIPKNHMLSSYSIGAFFRRTLYGMS